MKAVGLFKHLPISDPESLVDLELPIPQPSGRDLLVRVDAVSVNPVDTKIRAAKGTIESSPRILGWDAAGVVERVGPGVTLFQKGDAVYYAGDLSRPGSNSQYQLVDERIVAHKPVSLDVAQAAAVPLVAITAYESLFERLGIDRSGAEHGRTILIIGGAGGVGSMGIQLAKLAGLTVLATASRSESAAWAKSLGAVHVLDHTKPMRPQIEHAGWSFIDYIADFNDTDAHWDAMADLIKPQGKLCTIVDNRGSLKQELLKAKSITHAWEFIFTRAKYQTEDMIEQHRLLARIAQWFDEGMLRMIMREKLTPINAANLRLAHSKIESGSMIGKMVLEGW